MAIVTLIDARLYMAEFNLSGDHNTIALDLGVNEGENTVFGNTATSVKGTQHFINLTGQGFVTTGDNAVHDVLSAKIDTANVPVTVAPNGVTEGVYAETFLARTMRYNPFDVGDVGEHLAFKFDAKGQGVQPVQGTIVGSGSKTSTGNSAEFGLGTVLSTDTIYAALHVLSVSGTNPTLAFVIESDATGFGSATTALTFAQKTAVGSEWISDSTATTSDDFWRGQWTIGGTDTPTFNIVVAFGIESHA